jgi:hypothetical protein
MWQAADATWLNPSAKMANVACKSPIALRAAETFGEFDVAGPLGSGATRIEADDPSTEERS